MYQGDTHFNTDHKERLMGENDAEIQALEAEVAKLKQLLLEVEILDYYDSFEVENVLKKLNQAHSTDIAENVHVEKQKRHQDYFENSLSAQRGINRALKAALKNMNDSHRNANCEEVKTRQQEKTLTAEAAPPGETTIEALESDIHDQEMIAVAAAEARAKVDDHSEKLDVEQLKQRLAEQRAINDNMSWTHAQAEADLEKQGVIWQEEASRLEERAAAAQPTSYLEHHQAPFHLECNQATFNLEDKLMVLQLHRANYESLAADAVADLQKREESLKQEQEKKQQLSRCQEEQRQVHDQLGSALCQIQRQVAYQSDRHQEEKAYLQETIKTGEALLEREELLWCSLKDKLDYLQQEECREKTLWGWIVHFFFWLFAMENQDTKPIYQTDQEITPILKKKSMPSYFLFSRSVCKRVKFRDPLVTVYNIEEVYEFV